jgi:hypothetical protein
MNRWIKSAAGSGPAAGGNVTSGGFVSTHIVAHSHEVCQVLRDPDLSEVADLGARAEIAGFWGDYDLFQSLRRRMLLTQARTYEALQEIQP